MFSSISRLEYDEIEKLFCNSYNVWNMDKLVIRSIKRKEEIPWNLLLLADPSKTAIEKYIHESDIYLALINDKTVGVYVLSSISPDVFELKNVAVEEKLQGKGIGKKLVLDAISKAGDKKARRIEVGTGNSSLSQLALYQKCGFRIIGVEKDFFVKNYRREIVENGIKCLDMVRLAIDSPPSSQDKES